MYLGFYLGYFHFFGTPTNFLRRRFSINVYFTIYRVSLNVIDVQMAAKS